MKLHFALLGIAMLILLAGSPTYAQNVGTQSPIVIPAMTTSPVFAFQMTPVLTPLVLPVAAISILQPIVIVGQPILLGPAPVVMTPGFFMGTFPVPAPAR